MGMGDAAVFRAGDDRTNGLAIKFIRSTGQSGLLPWLRYIRVIQNRAVVSFVPRMTPARAHIASAMIGALILALAASFFFARFARETRVAVALAMVAKAVSVTVQRALDFRFARFPGITKVAKAFSIRADTARATVHWARQRQDFLARRSSESWVAVALSHQTQPVLPRGPRSVGPTAIIRATIRLAP